MDGKTVDRSDGQMVDQKEEKKVVLLADWKVDQKVVH